MTTTTRSELIQELFPSHEPFRRYTGRKEVLKVNHAYGELSRESYSIAYSSVRNMQALLAWPEATEVLNPMNEVYGRRHDHIAIVECGWLEEITEQGTKYKEWARVLCNRPQTALYEFPHGAGKSELFTTLPGIEHYQDCLVFVFPDVNIMIAMNCALGDGVADVYLDTPCVTALVGEHLKRFAESLGPEQKRTYPQLYERCFKQPLAA